MSDFFIRSILLLSLFAVGCKKDESSEAEDMLTTQVEELPDDFVVPEVIWKSMRAKNPEDKEKPIIYSSVKVLMKEKNKSVLKKPTLSLELPRGGGDIDLSAAMGSKSGTFYLNFELPEFENVFSKKAFFISENRKRKVDGEILGTGCRKILDITTGLFNQIKESGIKINTTRFRHDSILGGHLIFIGETDKNWLLTQVTFFDSERMDLFCQGFRVAGVNH